MYLFIIGTRPEAIKMCPVILEFRKHYKELVKVCLTGQHGDIVHDILKIFDVKYDYDFEIMKSSQSITYIITTIIENLQYIFNEKETRFVFVHGDTTTAMASTIAAFQNKIKIVHIEAGLRTNNINSPFPEESNRRIISQLSWASFCPTIQNLNNLEKENNHSHKFVVGNSVVDAIEIMKNKMVGGGNIYNNEYILFTTHRRENIGTNMEEIFEAINEISIQLKINIIFPMHPNPIIKEIFDKKIKNNIYIKLMEPQNYFEFSRLMINAKIIITDSGGIQEEASYLGKPLIILREETEREEVLENKNTFLVGHNKKEIIIKTQQLLNNYKHLNKDEILKSPFGDGKTSIKIYENFSNLIKR